jgi:hypothetical protein
MICHRGFQFCDQRGRLGRAVSVRVLCSSVFVSVTGAIDITISQHGHHTRHRRRQLFALVLASLHIFKHPRRIVVLHSCKAIVGQLPHECRPTRVAIELRQDRTELLRVENGETCRVTLRERQLTRSTTVIKQSINSPATMRQCRACLVSPAYHTTLQRTVHTAPARRNGSRQCPTQMLSVLLDNCNFRSEQWMTCTKAQYCVASGSSRNASRKLRR